MSKVRDGTQPAPTSGMAASLEISVANTVSESTATVPPPLKRLITVTPAALAALRCTSSSSFLPMAGHGNGERR